jgi:SAM-dependent methyltransferase
VLELGPGSGDQMHHYDQTKVEVLYAAEPNRFLHSKLREAADRAGIRAFYPIECGAENDELIKGLINAGVVPANSSALPKDGIFDTVVAVKSLCSTNQSEMIQTTLLIAKLLRPRGEFLFFEHVHSNKDKVTSWFVWLVNFVWPSLMGNCHLDGRLDRVLEQENFFDHKDIKTVQPYEYIHPFRYVVGQCIRSS